MTRKTRKQVEQLVAQIATRKDLRHDLWKGHHMSGVYGWYLEPFGRNAEYLGRNLTVAYEALEAKIGEADETILLSEHAPSQGDTGPHGIRSQAGDYLHVWQDEDGEWWFCFSGITANDGNYYESEDMGPFQSKAEAMAGYSEYTETIALQDIEIS